MRGIAMRGRHRNRGLAIALGVLLAATTPFSIVPAAAATVSALAIDADTGEILYADNPDQGYFPASLTKMMTLYLAFEALDQGRLTLDQRLPVSRQAAAQPPSRLGLAPGETISVEHAILALVTKSANDIAVVLAEAMGGGEPEFARMMTRTARALGMGRTNFRNASGLHERLQYTTARDMAKLARALIQDYPAYYPYFSTPSFTYRGVTHRNHNALLGAYGGVDGIKTGYVRASGYNLTASALRDGVRVIGVVLGGNTPSERDRAMVAVLDAGFRRVATLQRREDILAFPGRDPAQALAMTGPGIAAAAAPGRPMVPPPVNAPAGDWAIQVGAYRDYEGAEARLEQALAALPLAYARAEGLILPGGEGDPEPLYRARLAGLTEDQATAACAALAPRGVPCLPVAPGEDTAAAADPPRRSPLAEILRLLADVDR